MSPPLGRRVLVVGDLVTDIVVVHDGPLAIGSDIAAAVTITGGGSAANTAAWLAAQGVRVDLVSVVGADRAGTDRVGELAAAGVGCTHIRRTTDAATGSVVVLVNADERTMLCDRAANLLLVPGDVDEAVTASPDAGHLHLSGYVLLDAASRPAGRHALASATERGLTTSVDAASEAPLRRVGAASFLGWVRGVDLLLANLAEARALLGDSDARPATLAQRLCRVARHAVVKLGPDGAAYAGPIGGARVAAAPVDVVDPTGAGDAFAAGLLAAWARGDAIGDAVAAAVRLGTAAVTVLGGRPTPQGR